MSETGGKADKYQKGDRVFAKLKGYPPWPAQVQERSAGKEEKYYLHFYGTHDSAHVKPQMMYPYTPETTAKYGKPSKPSPTFKKAMEEIEANLELYLSTDEPQALVQEETFEEGELQIDETPPPVLKREGKITAPKSLPKEPVVKQPVVKQPARRLSKAAKRDSVSISNVVSLPSPIVETPPPITTAQPEIVSRSGRKIKPKRFADDEIGSPVSILAKAALQSSFEESRLDTPTAAKRTKKGQKGGGSSPLTTVVPVAPVLAEPIVTPKPTKEPALPKSKGKASRAVTKVPVEPQPVLTPVATTVSSRRKNTPVTPVAPVARVPSPVAPVPVSIPIAAESPAPSPPENDSESNTTPALSKADEDEPMEDFTEEDTHEYTEDKENSAGSWVNNAREEDSGSDESSSSKTEIKQFTEIPVSPDESSAESIKISLAVKKDTEVEITYNHDKPKEFPTQKARIEWDVATAKNILKVRQTLESLEPSAVELFNELAAAVEQKEEELFDAMEKALSEKRAEKLRKLRMEGEVIEIIGDVINCLSARAADCDRAIELLDRLKNHSLDTLVLKKNPEIVETVRKLRHYEGNAEIWGLTPEETDEFDEKAMMIREKAHKIYESFKTLFEVTPDKPFQQTFEDELVKFKEYCSLMTPKDFLNLTEEPSSENADIVNPTDDIEMEENLDADLDEVTNDDDEIDGNGEDENGILSDAEIDESTVDDEGGVDGDEESENAAENDTDITEGTDNDVDGDGNLGDDQLNNESDTLGSESET